MNSKHPEFTMIEAYMQEEPDYDFLMSYIFKNYLNVDPEDLAGQRYINDRWGKTKFYEALDYIYECLDIKDVNKVVPKFFKQVAKHLLANISIQIAVDKLIKVLEVPHAYQDPRTKITYTFKVDHSTPTVFTKYGTTFPLTFACSNGRATAFYTIWLELTPPATDRLQQNWKTWPVYVTMAKRNSSTNFADINWTLLRDLLLETVMAE